MLSGLKQLMQIKDLEQGMVYCEVSTKDGYVSLGVFLVRVSNPGRNLVIQSM